MITVFDIMTSPFFQDFRICCGKNGLSNPVSGTGIFDWESKEDMPLSFRKDEFVMTTLAVARGNDKLANEIIVNLLRNGISALCIKDVFFKKISPENMQLSEQLAIPIFFFSNTYFDDIIFEIRGMLSTDIGRLLDTLLSPLKQGMSARFQEGVSDPSLEEQISRKLAPYLHQNYLCGAAFPREETGTFNEIIGKKRVTDDALLTIPFQNGVLLLLSSDEGENLNPNRFLGIMDELGLSSHDYFVGASEVSEDKTAVLERVLDSIQACVVGFLHPDPGEDVLVFQESSIENYLIASFCTKSGQEFYQKKRLVLDGYDEAHDTDFSHTLFCYIQSGGDLNQTAKMVFQHANTVRYRIGKIKTLFGLDGPDSYAQLYLYGKMNRLDWVYENILEIN